MSGRKPSRALAGWPAFATGLFFALPLTAAEHRAQRDAWGRVVLTEAGEKVNYPSDEGTPPTWRPGRPGGRLRPPVERTPAAIQVREEWRRGTLGYDIGGAGLHVVDVDADGSQEIVVASGSTWSSGAWSVLRHHAGGYVQEWISDELPDGISSLRVAQLDGDAPLEVLAGSGGEILVYDGATRQLERTISTAASEIRGLTVVDVDSDGQLELVFCDASALYVYDVVSGQQEYSGPGYGGWELAVGNVDDDAGLEIVVANGTSPGFVLDGQTHLVEWTNFWGFGYHVRLGDLDGDGRQEAVSSNGWGTIAIFDVDLQSLAATIPTQQDIAALQVLDVEQDGPLEIVYGDGQWGSIYVLDGQTHAVKWSVPNPEHGVTDIAFGDPDDDGTRELLWGAGATSSGPDYLYVVNAVTQVQEWRSEDLPGPFYALSYGDVDADGQPELLYGSLESDSGYGGGVWFVHDAATHELEYESPLPPWGPGGLWRIANANVDGDPQQEIFVSENGLSCYDGLSHAQQWQVTFPDFLELESLLLADVDLDGQLEIVGAGEGYSGTFVFVLAAASGALEWQSPQLAISSGGTPSLLRVANVDGDANPEILLAAYQGQVFVIDGVTHVINNLGDHDTTALDTPDRDGDGVAEIVVGTEGGQVQVLNTTGTVVENVASYPGPIHGLRVLDVTGDGIADAVLAVDEEVLIRNGASGTTEWSSGTLRYDYSSVGAHDSLLVADVDQDGRLEIVVNLESMGFRVYEIPAAGDVSVTIDDSADPILVGGNVTYTITASNAAAQPVDGVVVSDVLGPGLAFVSSTPGAPTCTPAGQTVTCNLGTLGGGASAVVAVTAQAASPGALASQASVAASAPDPVPLNNTATETTTVTQTLEADLAMDVDDGRFTVLPGQAVSYTLTVANFGPWPVSAVGVTDTIPPALQNPVFTPSVGSYDPVTGAWTGLALGAGTSATMTLAGSVDPAATGLLSNSASVAPPAGVNDFVPANNTASDTDVLRAALPELAHGSRLAGSEWIAGLAFYRIRQLPGSSYEVVLDAMSGDVGGGSPVGLDRLAGNLSDVISTSVPAGSGRSRSLRWENATAGVVDDEVVRVLGTGCSPGCGPDDVYRLRAYDTTLSIPRFNNSGSQLTVVVLENTTTSPASGTLWFWGPPGTLLASHAISGLAPRASLVLNTSAIPGLGGQSGSVTVSHDAGYGGLEGKAVAVEPATGFSFDSPLTPRPR